MHDQCVMPMDRFMKHTHLPIDRPHIEKLPPEIKRPSKVRSPVLEKKRQANDNLSRATPVRQRNVMAYDDATGSSNRSCTHLECKNHYHIKEGSNYTASFHQ